MIKTGYPEYDEALCSAGGDARKPIPGLRDLMAAKKTAQLWAILRTDSRHSDGVYWAKCELRKRGYCV